MLKRNIYIPIEFENRELVSQLLLSIFAAKKGFRVYIGNFACILKLLEKKKDRSGIFIVKGGLNIKLTNFVKRKCEHYLVMDQEISPGFKNSYYINLTSNRFLEPTVKEIDQYYCLNDYILKAVKKDLARDGCAVLKKFLTESGIKALVEEAEAVSQNAHKSFNRTN